MPSLPPTPRAYRVLASVLRPILFAITRRDWQGAEHLPPTGVIVAANHVTEVDPVTLAHFLYDQGRAPKITAKASLWKVPVVGPVLRRTGMIPVHRGTSGAAQALVDSTAQLDGGECVVFFPEGTLTRDPDGWPMQGKTGVARLALTSRAPVVPVGQWGAHRLLAPYGKLFKPIPPKHVAVHAGPPVDLSDLYDRPLDAATLREATDRIMAAITVQVEQIRGEKAPAERFDMRKNPGSERRR
ncbi:lysophospholipid acyltransferase family protein [Cellulosimicrobium marinum]|uniref:lysophospholipid acyltransferase family protein n=1 Tax=Cellulosimicrobium marinum TaxID=1638992 RepID=UPI001E37C04E|nr:lysophospholipid acyltransferase family protein [Cellulosimicrobium marinum]MCB7137927.1 1-acyl-sn-glycerol-3-phosphate acyltransferase [Cellulosimicrobium marinum]